MMEDTRIIEMFFERDQQAIQELDTKYGKVCHKLSYNIVNNRYDAEECVNDAYLDAWNTIPPTKPQSLQAYICKISTSAVEINQIDHWFSFNIITISNHSILNQM